MLVIRGSAAPGADKIEPLHGIGDPAAAPGFLGCGFITRVHSGHLRSLRADVIPSYASRERAKADDYCRRFNGGGSYGDYEAAIDDPSIDAVVIAVPPRFHLDLDAAGAGGGKACAG